VDDWGDWADVDRSCADVSIMKPAKQNRDDGSIDNMSQI
jgi:hypothetical protein